MEPSSTRDIEILFKLIVKVSVVGNTLARGDSQISFKRVTTQGDFVYRQYCLLPAPEQLI